MKKRVIKDYRLYIIDPTYQGKWKYINCKEATEINQLGLVQKTIDTVLTRVITDENYLRTLLRG